MSVREITDYSLHALGNGCFFNGSHKLKVRDANGVMRDERLFSTDRVIELEDEGVVEFGEAAASEIAHALGWVDPRTHGSLVESSTDLNLENDRLRARVVELEEALMVLQKVNVDLSETRQYDTAEFDKVSAENRSLRGRLGSEAKKIKSLEAQLAKLADFGGTS